MTITLAVYLLWTPLVEWNVDTNILHRTINKVETYVSDLHEQTALTNVKMKSFLQQCQMIRMTASTRNGVIAKHMMMAFEELGIERVRAYGETFQEYRQNGWRSANDTMKEFEVEAQTEKDESAISESVLSEIHSAVESVRNAEIADEHGFDPFNLEPGCLTNFDSNLDLEMTDSIVSPNAPSEENKVREPQVVGYCTGILVLCVFVLVIYSGWIWKPLRCCGSLKQRRNTRWIVLQAANALGRVIVRFR